MGYRINERNIGSFSLDGEPKKRKRKTAILPELSNEQEQALHAVSLIETILKSHKNNYYSYIRYDVNHSIIAKWIESGIVTKGIKNPEPRFSKLGIKPKEICILNPESIPDLQLIKGLLTHFFKLNNYI